VTVAKRLETRVLQACARDEAAAAWLAAEEGIPDRPLACSWRWTVAWLEQYADAVPHRFVIGEREGRPVAAALLTRAAGGNGGRARIRRLHVGTAGEPSGEGIYVERNGLLAHVADRPLLARAIVDAANEQRGWDELLVDGFVPEHAAAVAAVEPRMRLRVEPSPCCDLGPVIRGEAQVPDLLGSGPRSHVRQTLRTFGSLELEWPEDRRQARRVFDELVELHERHWQRKSIAGAFASRRALGFHHRLIADEHAAEMVALVRVRSDRGTVGCLYGLLDGDSLLFYQGGLTHFEDNRLRSGLAAHVTFMRACADRGIRRYDFLAGPARYKDELTTEQRDLVWGALVRRWLRPTVRRLGHRVLQRP
jgi:hypothetical protein